MVDSLIADNKRLDSCLKDIPNEPGCYLMRDKDEKILYIGKSKDLNKRVRSYFRAKEEHTPRISLMVRQVFDIEVIVTDTEEEALKLESNLIKYNQPYFNVLLKDDKKYPYLCITWSELYPRIFITRKRHNRKNRDKYYGPYVDVTFLRKTLLAIKSLFPLRQRSIPVYKDKTCLNYSIKRCPGVCQGLISPEDYNKTLEKVEMIFQGRTSELKELLVKKMNHHSSKLEYEKASVLRDQIKGLDQIGDSQKVSLPNSTVSRDIVAMDVDEKICSIQLFQMRSGKLVGRLGYISKRSNEPLEYILQRIVEEHYSNIQRNEIPREILTQYKLPQQEIISEWLFSLMSKKVKIYSPIRGEKLNVVKLVKKNAKYELDRIKRGQERHSKGIEELAQLLEMTHLPRRIEGFDISHIQGSDAVASQVVFIDGIPAKHHYRKYKIKDSEIRIGHSDDYVSIREVIRRRFKRWSAYKQKGGNIKDLANMKATLFDTLTVNDWPDLVMIDGGKGQLNAALTSLRELNLEEDVNLCSLAKKKEEVFIPYKKESLKTDLSDPSLILLRRLRDEAHRFAISFHKQRRSKRMTKSELSSIPGLGSKRIKDLHNHFKSVEAIRLASPEELNKVKGLGVKMSNTIWKYFNHLVE